CGFVGGDRGRRRHRQARAEPRRRSTGHYPRRPVRRRLRRLWNCLGARGQSVAHAGRGGDQRELQECSQRGFRRRSAGDRFHRQGVARGLPAGQDVFYRIRFQDHSFPSAFGSPQVGHFRTAPSERRTVSFVWSGDTAGGGWGIDEARGGMRTYATMLKSRPDFFIHCADHLYADCPLHTERKLPNGEVWRNIVTEDKSKIAQTLAEFRGNYKYNLLDKNVLAFNAEVPLFAQWDDHEVTNDWCPGEALRWGGYADRSVLKLAARGCRAFHEFMPMRETLAEAGRIYRKIPYRPLPGL